MSLDKMVDFLARFLQFGGLAGIRQEIISNATLLLQFGDKVSSATYRVFATVSSAGTTHCLNEPMICRLIRDAGFIPAQRDNAYDLLKVHAQQNAPDLAIEDWSTCRPQKLHAENEPGCSNGATTTASSDTIPLTIENSP